MTVDFIGIGAQKSATSWLHDVLSEHPDILASDLKELNFFTANYDRGHKWYEHHFVEAKPAQKCGECSPTYFFSHAAPIRAKTYNPDMRLIAVLRDPVRRAYSNHLHEIRKGHIPSDTSFEDALSANPAYIEQGRYAANLSRWLESFDREALLVLLAEDIQVDPDSAFRAVCRHLGVTAEVRPDTLNERRHESVTNRNEAAQKVLRAGGNLARSMGLGKSVEAVKKAPVISSVLAMNKKDLRTSTPPMTDVTRIRLIEEFAGDMRYVADLLGRDPLPWESWAALSTREAADAV